MFKPHRLPAVCQTCATLSHRRTLTPSTLTRHLSTFRIVQSRQPYALGKKSIVQRIPSVHLGVVPRRLASSQFQPLKPPSPESLGRAKQAKHYPKSRKWLRRLIRLALAAAVVIVADEYMYDAALTRSLRCFWTGLVVALDYKINFRPDPWIGDSVNDLHSRSAQRVFDLLRNNGGLYLKIGQAVAMQSAILPPEFQKMFARMFDDAPQNDWADVEAVIREDFGGRSVEEVFGPCVEKTARASASVAQVHWARLEDGREVAIKIQKREIARQVGWDLWAFKVVTKIYTWYFDLPLYTLVPYISERLMLETDFQNEAKNSEKMRDLILGEKRLKGRVYVPKVYDDLSTKRVMTAEWIEGVRLWDKEGIQSAWYGGYGKGSPGAGGATLPPLPPQTKPDAEGHLKPARDEWRGPVRQNGKHMGGLGLDYKPIMQSMIDLFSAQMFLWGTVHCDPHPGNIFVRRLPSGKPELVLIDHGLYIYMSSKFRLEYALLWRSLLTFDNKAIQHVVKDQWGVNAPEIFASMTLMRPYEGGEHRITKGFQDISKMDRKQQQFEMQKRMQQGVRDVLADEKSFPQELIFIGRNLRIVQGNNQFLGSPVNRVKIVGTWASRALSENREVTWTERWKEYGKHLLFRTVLWSTDIFFYISKIRQLLGFGKGMDDDIEQSMKKMAENVGVELNHGVFDG